MNLLAHETSPYLLQHASNPVYWKAWNQETLAQANTNQKLLIISIGYSACHWCHVMEHESFEDEAVAELMNAHFTSIKIDREERPDLDAIYMKALQIMTGQGGWPLNIVALPDGRPVWGGTYFRKGDWMDSLHQLQEIFSNQPDKIADYAQRLQTGMAKLIELDLPTQLSKDTSTLDPLIEKWKKSFDHDFGGMARSPKFMMPNNYQFLLQYAVHTQDPALADFVQLTLTKMGYGGVFDVIGGGFSRYSVDAKWHIPHFEKMAYDNGQLLQLYAQAYKKNKDPLYLEVIQKTMQFIETEWTSAENGIFSAWDADSLNSLHEMEEGAYYVWTKNELMQLLGSEYALFCEVFNVNEFGYWEHDQYVLIRTQSLETIAGQTGISVADLESKKTAWENSLYHHRAQRSKPGLDDKCLCSWNGIMLSGIVAAYQAVGNKHYLEQAIKTAHFISQTFLQPEGNLLHTYKNKKATINGFLEDYAFTIAGFIDLYEATFEEKWLLYSKELMAYCLEHFYEAERNLFSFTSRLDPALVSEHFETEDNVIPASNSVMAHNLLRLGCVFADQQYRNLAEQMIELIVYNADYPSAFSNWLSAFMRLLPTQLEIAICGENAYEYSQKLNGLYLPHCQIVATEKASELPFLKNRYSPNQTLFYCCQNQQCDLPFSDFNLFLKRVLNA
jgi:uncharacterized protein YyaL (SSP411 family)